MTHTSRKEAETQAAKYKTESEQDAYLRGFDRGYNCASWIDLPEIGTTVWTEADGKITVDSDNQWDIVSALASDGESNDRQFSPFEFTASEFNSAEDEDGESISDELWDAFDSGIGDGINANIRERSSKMEVK